MTPERGRQRTAFRWRLVPERSSGDDSGFAPSPNKKPASMT